MELDIIWSKRAAAGYSKMLKYLDQKWTKKEVVSFEQEMVRFFNILCKHLYIFEKSEKRGCRRGPINKHTILIYRVIKENNQIQLISFRSAKQKPLK